MPDRFDWGGLPTAHGWYAVVLQPGPLPYPGARFWRGSAWDSPCGIVAHHGPHADAEEALDWAEERCPEE